MDHTRDNVAGRHRETDRGRHPPVDKTTPKAHGRARAPRSFNYSEGSAADDLQSPERHGCTITDCKFYDNYLHDSFLTYYV